MVIKLELDAAALDAAQAKADKLEFTLEKIQVRLDMLAGVDPKTPEDEAKRKLIRWRDGLYKIVSQAQEQAKEKPPEGGKTCERTPPDPELLRKAQARVDARKRGSDDSVDVLCATLDKVIRCVAQDIFKPPN